ncbi:hypothetical protein RGR602_PC01988 (plasmid) [Rhizobium gallicum bv. gallicum R602sp]|uniref:Uncharacterized protein n=1 Tax=Rhizobium gallicum bv. gallicum R602sp TaxID=1041138 RepID=A0A0B4XG09_9HYPH|nr:hypothetical protein RGR602_PC01988 [Rhizobium gallicum bv. gallicum R602sp]
MLIDRRSLDIPQFAVRPSYMPSAAHRELQERLKVGRDAAALLNVFLCELRPSIKSSSDPIVQVIVLRRIQPNAV